MESRIKEIAAVLRSTESMAAQFAQRVQERVGQPVSHTEILSAMQKISAKSLSLEKVVTKVQQEQKKKGRQVSRRSSRSTSQPLRPARAATDVPSQPAPSKRPGTIWEKLEAVLRENWDRATAEGLSPNRMSTEAFVNAVYQYTDRREATRRRILQAVRQLDQTDVLLTPALVADTVHELFQG